MDGIDFSLLKKPVVLAGALIVGILVFVLLIAKRKPAAPDTTPAPLSNPGQPDMSQVPPQVFILAAPAPGGANTAPPQNVSGPTPTPRPTPTPANPPAAPSKPAAVTIHAPTPTPPPPPPKKPAGPTPGVVRSHQVELSRAGPPALPPPSQVGARVHVTVAPSVRIPLGVARYFNLKTVE